MRFEVDVQQIKRGFVKMGGLDPAAHPEFVSAALRACMEDVLDTSRRTQLSGPRPLELDRVTGELANSLAIDDSALPNAITGGTSVVYAPVHEFGRQGKLSFLAPALDLALPRFPDLVEREWLRSFDAA